MRLSSRPSLRLPQLSALRLPAQRGAPHLGEEIRLRVALAVRTKPSRRSHHRAHQPLRLVPRDRFRLEDDRRRPRRSRSTSARLRQARPPLANRARDRLRRWADGGARRDDRAGGGACSSRPSPTGNPPRARSNCVKGSVDIRSRPW